MNNIASTSKRNSSTINIDDEEVFEDSTILANFNNSSFKETSIRVSESNINDSINTSGLNVSALCCDEEISGYDKLTGRTWIYPTNYPVRDYQFNIIKAAILKNTLVSLPTGLGKTFIAAVIMYNFYRWYPLGKIVFTAPTRPLVAQQIDACYNIIAIPPNDTVEMTGHMPQATRKTHWQTKRVFFATPQVIYNDIKSGICPGERIRCLVIDEAHRARGNYAYCQIVGTLTDMGHKTYRLLALSATPGSKTEDVANVVKSLHIAHLELRTEDCIDVAPYSHVRKINTVIIQLGPELTQLRQQYVEILDGYARRLKQLNILPTNLGNLSKGRVVMLYKEFQTKERGSRHPQHSYIMKDFTVLISLYHGLELLLKHGSRVFLNFFDEHPEKSWIQADDQLTALLERLRDDLGINPLALDTSILPDGTIPEIPKNLCFGHPKFYKLKEIMMEHFSRAKQNHQDTRAIVFCEYRESVNLVHCLLLQCRPLIAPQMFVGRGASGKDGKTVVSQKQQLRVMRNFREGACNALVATCVAEEGLDVGSVDLILCFDISTRSPIRLVQRCGRTGRERGGQVFILVTEGREHQTLLDCMRQRDGLNKKILQSREVQACLYAANPRMIPHDFMPQCQKMHITVAKKSDPKSKDAIEKAKKGQKDLRTMLLGRASSSSSGSSNKEFESNYLISKEEFNEMFPEGYLDTNYIQQPKEYWAMNKETFRSMNKVREGSRLNLSTWLEWQRSLQKTVNVEHSKDTEILASLLQYSDAKRFDLPASTQNPTFNTQEVATQNFVISPVKISSPAKPKPPKKKLKVPLLKSPGKKDGDIRALFSTATKSTKSYTKFISDLGIQNDGSIPTRLINLVVDLSLDNTNNTKKCFICHNICDCKLIQDIRKHKSKPSGLLTCISEPKFPNIELIDEIDADLILKCAKKHRDVLDFDLDTYKANVSYHEVDNKNGSKNFDFDFSIDITSPENAKIKDKHGDENVDNYFNIGDIEDIFADSPPEETSKREAVEIKTKIPNDANEALEFFGLDSIDDIFADSDDGTGDKFSKTPPSLEEVQNKEKEIKANNQVIVENKTKSLENPISPSILSGKQTSIPKSPILCSQVRKFRLSTKKNEPQTSTPISNVRRRLIPEPNIKNKKTTATTENIQKSKSVLQNDHCKTTDTSNKSMFTITQLVDMINNTGHDKSLLSNNSKKIDNQINTKEDERNSSPILLTQTDSKKFLDVTENNKSNIYSSQYKRIESLIILDSDSDSENDAEANVLNEENEANGSKGNPSSENNNKIEKEANTTEQFQYLTNSKRKIEIEHSDSFNASPYFNKRRKLDDDDNKSTLQQKVLAALTANKINNDNFNNDSNVNFTLSPRISFFSQKENQNPYFMENEQQNKNSDDEKEYVRKTNLEMLQIFRRDSKIKSPKTKFDAFINSPKKAGVSYKRKISFHDSDDDFIDGESDHRTQRPVNNGHKNNFTTNHKVRKKNKKANSFLDLEAELSDDGRDSGDELSDESAGSIADFICDDLLSQEDIQAVYIRSIKSPVKGVFKIPNLPKKFENAEIFSQFVEEDHYEMDSFCVDSHIGLTQFNDDVSDLEVAESILEERKSRRKRRDRLESTQDNDESPLVKGKFKNVKRIHSDSDDSS